MKATVLRKWAPRLMLDVVCLDTAPVWVKLWHVPLELYSQQGLGYVASALGHLLYMDRATVLKKQLEFAKICIDWMQLLICLGADGQCGVHTPVQEMASGIGLGNASCGLEEPHVAVGGVGLKAVGCGLEEPLVAGSDVVLETACCVLEGPQVAIGVSVPACSIDHVASVISGDGVVSGFVVGVQQDVVVGVDKASPSHHVSGSPNSFGALSPEVEDVEVRDVSPRRGRAAAEGFAVLMQNLKPKVKEPNKKKGRGRKQGKGKGGKGEVPDALLKEMLGVELTTEMGDSLAIPVTHQEIKDVIFAMN
ncbi:hypothetical protein V6N13_020783 [Hibiscus sabdariffa]